MCDISDQCGDDSHKIKVDVRYATNDEIGQIAIFKLETDEVICTRETSKREDNQKIDIK